MALISADRVKETTTITGTGTATLLGAATGYRAFSAVCANGDICYYCIAAQSGSEWELGLGTWNTGNTLARTTVISSSNAGALVNFSAGTKDVFITLPAATIRPESRGTATLNFGTGTTDTSVAVTGQTGIVSTSQVFVKIKVEATANHTADEVYAENLQVFAGNIIAGTGFTIYGKSTLGIVQGQFTIEWSWS